MNSEMNLPWNTDYVLTWPMFLAKLENYCTARGWEVEFTSVDDYSCAIFAQSEHDNEDFDAAEDLLIDDFPF